MRAPFGYESQYHQAPEDPQGPVVLALSQHMRGFNDQTLQKSPEQTQEDQQSQEIVAEGHERDIFINQGLGQIAPGAYPKNEEGKETQSETQENG